MNFEPAFSSLSFNGRKRHTTLMLSSAAISRSADIFAAESRCYVFYWMIGVDCFTVQRSTIKQYLVRFSQWIIGHKQRYSVLPREFVWLYVIKIETESFCCELKTEKKCIYGATNWNWLFYIMLLVSVNMYWSCLSSRDTRLRYVVVLYLLHIHTRLREPNTQWTFCFCFAFLY